MLLLRTVQFVPMTALMLLALMLPGLSSVFHHSLRVTIHLHQYRLPRSMSCSCRPTWTQRPMQALSQEEPPGATKTE